MKIKLFIYDFLFKKIHFLDIFRKKKREVDFLNISLLFCKTFLFIYLTLKKRLSRLKSPTKKILFYLFIINYNIYFKILNRYFVY